MMYQVRLRKSDTDLIEHFKQIKKGDVAHEVRRLIKIGLEIEKERNQKESQDQKSKSDH